MKKIIIISSSPRENSNSYNLCLAFQKGAESVGNQVELVRIKDHNIGFCTGCYSCHKTGKCFQKDDGNMLAEKVLNADVVVLATPVYFYTMSAQLKVFLDRLTPFYEQLEGKEVYVIATAWDPDTKNLELTAESIRGATRDCWGAVEKGVLLVGGADAPGDTLKMKEYQTAYEMGKNC